MELGLDSGMKCRMFVDTPKLHLSEARQIEFVNRYFRENTRNLKDRGEGKGSSGSQFPLSQWIPSTCTSTGQCTNKTHPTVFLLSATVLCFLRFLLANQLGKQMR